MSGVQTQLSAKAHVYGNHIDTDRIIPGKYTKTLDLSTLADHVLEDLDPNFNKIVKAGDVLVAGINFGCGSSREQAPLALKQAGVAVVIAKDFARIFFRNAINIGLPVLEIADHNIQKGAQLEIDLKTGRHHQIRSQLASMGVFIKGDLKYGAARSNTNGGIHLHARQLAFEHPVKKEVMRFTAPLPQDPLWQACQ